MVAPNSEFEEQNPQQQINIELSEAAADGIYSNLVLVSHSPSEFVIDFARLLPGPPKGKVHSRIIMTPMHAKSLIATLQENLSRYERNFGTIIPPAGQGPGGQRPGGGEFDL
ncbi:MAG TPA: DUF3467 domain-containing protein [Fibrobacteria bacterium]|nr:DUF3467 domain-containing protein [Fibrobacteria bacterium]